MPTAPAKALAVYGPKAMKEEGDEVASIKLMGKKAPEQKPKDRTKEPKPKLLKPAPETEKLTKKFAKGGTASKRADGCAVKGKTKGKMV